jgi:hypothetical protein
MQQKIQQEDATEDTARGYNRRYSKKIDSEDTLRR